MNRCKELRGEHKKKQKEIAEKVGISQQAYSNIENGSHLPSLPIAAKIASYFGKTVDYVFIDSDEYDLD